MGEMQAVGRCRGQGRLPGRGPNGVGAWLLGVVAACGSQETPARSDVSGWSTVTGAVTAQVASFQDGVAPSPTYAGTRDAMLRESAPAASSSAAPTAAVDGDDPAGTGLDTVALLRWDLSGIPTDAVVQSATLTLQVTNPSSQAYGVHTLARAWSEAATWDDADATSPWQAPGAAGPADRDPTPVASIAAAATGPVSVPFGSAGVAAVQAWVANPAANHGLVLAGGGNANGLDFATREAATPALRPRLSVAWLPAGSPPPPVPATLVALGSNWKFLVSDVSPGSSWSTATFGDGAWPAGPAQLGYGDGDEATVVGYGPDPKNRFPTTWFRHTVQVADAAAWQSLTLRVQRDDGVAVYLNGVEVLRDNLPTGALGADTQAVAAVEDAFVQVAVAPSLLVDGPNVLAAEVHQAGPTSSDVSFDLELIGTTTDPPPPPPPPLVASGGSWKYLDTGNAPDAGWTTPAFADGAWGTGNAPLGYGAGGLATTVGFGPSSGAKHPTTWFRRTFAVADPGAWAALTVDVLRDDGAIVYLNGTEILRSNLPAGPVTAATLATKAVASATWVSGSVDAGLLVAGPNVLAVEVHQASAGSSDLVLDLVLAGTPAADPGACPGGCDDGVGCTVDSCDAALGCQHVADAGACTDGNACTTDACSATTGCGHTPTAGACTDGNACTSGDSCSGGACTGSVVACTDGNGCTTDSCDPTSGCKYVANSDACNDGNACTTGDACTGGACTGNPANCNDGNACTTDSCDATGCKNVASTSGCNDGDACTTGDTCSSGTCAGVAMACDDGDACTDDGCSGGACTAVPVCSRSQAAWGGSGNDQANALKASGNGFVLAGSTTSSGVGGDALLVVTDSCGVAQWVRTYGGAASEVALAVETAADGGFVLAGESFSLDSDGDAFVIKTSATGAVQWSYAHGGASRDFAQAVHQTQDGGYVVTAKTYSFGPNTPTWHNGLIFKLNGAGGLVWSRVFGGDAGSMDSVQVREVRNGAGVLDGFLLVGGSEGFGQGADDVWLTRMNADGSHAWSAAFGGTSDDDPTGFVQTPDRGFLITGTTKGFGATGLDIFAMKTSNDGTLTWFRRFNGASTDEGAAIALQGTGAVLTGRTKSWGAGLSDAYALRIDGNGGVLSMRVFGGAGEDFGTGVAAVDGTRVAIAGRTASSGKGSYDTWLIRTGSDGKSGCNEVSVAMSSSAYVPVKTTFTPVLLTAGTGAALPINVGTPSAAGGTSEICLCE